MFYFYNGHSVGRLNCKWNPTINNISYMYLYAYMYNAIIINPSRLRTARNQSPFYRSNHIVSDRDNSSRAQGYISIEIMLQSMVYFYSIKM